MRDTTGGCMSCEVGNIHGKESKHKLNRNRTTETEFFAVSEYVSHKIHTINILLLQGYDLHKIFCTKTMKAKLRWENGRNSFTDNSRHIYIRCFFGSCGK